MESLNGGSLRKAMSCLSQVVGGMTSLAGVAAIGTLMTATPIGWVLLAGGVVSFIAGGIADPSACD